MQRMVANTNRRWRAAVVLAGIVGTTLVRVMPFRSVPAAFTARRIPTFELGDISDPASLLAVAESVAAKGELILLLADVKMADWAINFVGSLRALGYRHELLLARDRLSCLALRERWIGLFDRPPPCAWASEVSSHTGWRRWGLDPAESMLTFWASRWYAAAKLSDLLVSTLILDLDGYMVSDIYKQLTTQPMSLFDVVLTDISNRYEAGLCVQYDEHRCRYVHVLDIPCSAPSIPQPLSRPCTLACSPIISPETV